MKQEHGFAQVSVFIVVLGLVLFSGSYLVLKEKKSPKKEVIVVESDSVVEVQPILEELIIETIPAPEPIVIKPEEKPKEKPKKPDLVVSSGNLEKDISNSIVHLSCVKLFTSQEALFGSGIFISKEGHILTNAHIAKGSDHCFVSRSIKGPLTEEHPNAIWLTTYYTAKPVYSGNFDSSKQYLGLKETGWEDFTVLKIDKQLSYEDLLKNKEPDGYSKIKSYGITIANKEQQDKFSDGKTFPYLTLDLNYKPRVGDRLFIGGYEIQKYKEDEARFQTLNSNVTEVKDNHVILGNLSRIVNVYTSGGAVVNSSGKVVGLNIVGFCLASENPCELYSTTQGVAREGGIEFFLKIDYIYNALNSDIKSEL